MRSTYNMRLCVPMRRNIYWVEDSFSDSSFLYHTADYVRNPVKNLWAAKRPVAGGESCKRDSILSYGKARRQAGGNFIPEGFRI